MSEFVECSACGDLDGLLALLADSKTTAAHVNDTDKDGRTALHYACLNETKELVKALLKDKRVDVDKRTPRGDSCLHLASQYSSLEAIQLLLSDPRGKKLLQATNNFEETPLHLVAGSGDKKAQVSAKLLLESGASLLALDKWGRGPNDVSRDNAENPISQVFTEYMERDPALAQKVKAHTDAYFAKQISDAMALQRERKGPNVLLAGLGMGKTGLKKTETVVKTMFAKQEGRVGEQGSVSKLTSAVAHGKILSKMIEFPGDGVEIAKLLKDDSVDPGGADAYGVTAIHKFAAWNKTEFLEMLLPHLSREQINAQDRDGKTALHLAVEMASVGAINRLVDCDTLDKDVKDSKGRTALDIINSGGSSSVVERVKKALLKEK